MKNQFKVSSFCLSGVLVLTLITQSAKAQQTPFFNQYFQARSLTYSSSTVFEENRFLRFAYRNQFGGLEGAPKNLALAYNAQLHNRTALSLNVNSIDIGFIDQVKVSTGLGYKLFENSAGGLAIGTQVGLSFFGLNEDLINPDSPGDAVLANLLGQNGNSINVDLSATYRINALTINAVLPNLINESLSGDAYDQINADNAPDFMLGVDYMIDFNSSISMKPYLGIRTREVLGTQIDVLTEITYQDKLRINGGYRGGYGGSVGLGFQVSPKLMITYNYDLGKKDVPFLADGQSEFGIHLKLNNRADVKRSKLEEGKAVIDRVHEEGLFDMILVNDQDRIKAINYLATTFHGTKKEKNVLAQDAYEALFKEVYQQKLANREEERKMTVEAMDEPLKEVPENSDRVNVLSDLAQEEKAEIKKVLDIATERISFKTASAELVETSFQSLNEVVEVLFANSAVKLKLNGHTDDTGDSDKNLKLSLDRAMAVKGYLNAKGIDPDRVVVEGFGSTRPISDNDTSQGRALNRRVEMKIVKQ